MSDKVDEKDFPIKPNADMYQQPGSTDASRAKEAKQKLADKKERAAVMEKRDAPVIKHLKEEEDQRTKREMIREEICKQTDIAEKIENFEKIDTKSIAKDILYVLGSENVNLDEDISKQDVLDELRFLIGKAEKEKDSQEYLDELSKSTSFKNAIKDDTEFHLGISGIRAQIFASMFGLLENGVVAWKPTTRSKFTID